MDKQTYEALKRTMYRTIWKDTNAKKVDVYKIMDWIDEVSKDYIHDCEHTDDYQKPNNKGGWDIRCKYCDEYISNII